MNETELLQNLEKRKYDVPFQTFKQGQIEWKFCIEKGIPIRIRKGKKQTIQRFQTNEEKIQFLQKYGCIPELFKNHPEVMEYSLLYYKEESFECTQRAVLE